MKTVRELLDWAEEVKERDPNLEFLSHHYIRNLPSYQEGDRNNFPKEWLNIPKIPTEIEMELYVKKDLRGLETLGNCSIGAECPKDIFLEIIEDHGFRRYDEKFPKRYVHSKYGVPLSLINVSRDDKEWELNKLVLEKEALTFEGTPDIKDVFGDSINIHYKPEEEDEFTFSFNIGAVIPDTHYDDCVQGRIENEIRDLPKRSKTHRLLHLAIPPVLRGLIEKEIPIIFYSKGGDTLVHLPGILE